MSEELGQKGQKVNFDSANIGKKEKATQFTNIEGAKERAKAEERAKQAAEKEAAELHMAHVEAASVAQEKAERKERATGKKLLNLFFASWHKWVTIAALVLIIGGLVAYFVFLRKPEIEIDAADAAKALYMEQLAKIGDERKTEQLTASRDILNDAWEKANDDYSKFWYGYYYALYSRNILYSEETAYNILRDETVPDGIRDEDVCKLLEIEYMLGEYGLDLSIGYEQAKVCYGEEHE